MSPRGQSAAAPLTARLALFVGQGAAVDGARKVGLLRFGVRTRRVA